MKAALWINSSNGDSTSIAQALRKLSGVTKPLTVFTNQPELFKDNELVESVYDLDHSTEGYTLFNLDETGELVLHQVRGNIKLVHLLLNDDLDPQRQEKSIESLSKLKEYGVDYIQVWNNRWTEEPPRDTFTRPSKFDEIPIRPGHYGAFRAFADASIEHFTKMLFKKISAPSHV